MAPGELEFRLEGPAPPLSRVHYWVLLGKEEHLTSCDLVDDLVRFAGRLGELEREGAETDLFFSRAEPTTLSVAFSAGGLALRLTDNFSGLFREMGVERAVLKKALLDIARELERRLGASDPRSAALGRAVLLLETW